MPGGPGCRTSSGGLREEAGAADASKLEGEHEGEEGKRKNRGKDREEAGGRGGRREGG